MKFEIEVTRGEGLLCLALATLVIFGGILSKYGEIVLGFFIPVQ